MARKVVSLVLAIALAVILITGIFPSGFAAAQGEDGNPVSIDAAKQAAVNHMNKMLVNTVLAETGVLPSAADAFAETAASVNFTETKEGKNIYYAINLDPEGWVIVSADYVAYPIIAHSDEGSYSEENHPPAFDDWMENVKDEIYQAIENDLTPLQEASEAWDSFDAPTGDFLAKASAAAGAVPLAASVGPLMTTTWSQGGKSSFGIEPWAETYDYYCPWEKNWWGYYRVSYTGCVATATGQVMKYWGWPVTGEGSHTWDPPYVPTEDTGSGYAGYGPYTVNFGTRNYQWSLMSNKVTSFLWDIDDNEKKVAQVLRDIGVAVDMDYTPSGSGAFTPDVATALPTYFRYDWSANYKSRGSLTFDQWGNMLKAELNAGRPLVYRGTGHAFVCDGYNASNQFHFNWGWDGSDNGYYYLNDLTPGSHNYTPGQAGIFDLKPDYPPAAGNNAYSVNEDQTLSVGAPGVLGNDSDPFGQSLTAVKDTNPAHGTLTLNSNGSFAYKPNANFHGADSFTYHARDGRYNSGTVSVTITVHSVNDPPTAGNNAYSVNEDQTLSVGAPGVLGNDNDLEGNPITAVKDTNPTNGTLTLNANGSFIYEPNTDFDSTDSFTYHATDSQANSNIATVTITINPVNDPPVAEADGPYIGSEGSPVEFMGTGTDVDGDSLKYRWDFDDDGTWDTTLSDNGAASYTWDDDLAGTARVEVTDGELTSVDTTDVTVLNVPPTVDAGSDQSQYWDLPTNFNGTLSDPSDADTTSGLQPIWTFGDGDSATGLSVTHIYVEPDVYTATLTATDKDGGVGSDTSQVTVNKRETTLSYTGDNVATFGYAATLSAQLRDAVDSETARLSDRIVVFTIDGSIISATTNSEGVATATAPALLMPGTYQVDVAFAEDSHYLASSTQGTLDVLISVGKVTGGIIMKVNNKGRSGLNIHSDGTTVRGQFQFKDATENYHTSEIMALGIAPEGNSAWFTGIGKDERTFVAYVEDNGEPGTNDVFKLWIEGILYNDNGILAGGNIQIQK